MSSVAETTTGSDGVVHLPRHQKVQQKVPIAPVETIRKRLQLTQGAFAEAMGYNPSTYSDWISSGTVPKVASLAAEALMRRQAPDAQGPIYLLRTVKGVPQVTQIEPRSLVLDGKRYLLVEDPQ